MKSIKFMVGIVLISFVAVSLIACGGGGGTSTSTPAANSVPQGPRDPSFETGSPYWNIGPGCYGSYSGTHYASFVSGTGFMPTAGVKYALSDLLHNTCDGPGTLSIYQYNVDFSQSNTMKFDYEMNANNNGCPEASATVEILFTGNGTTTLWSKTFPQSGDVQKLSETVTLPSLPPVNPNIGVSNTFTINMVRSSGCGGFAFSIDNIRVTNNAGTAPVAPTGVNATAGNGQNTVSWNAVSGATSYNIYWSTTSGVTKSTGTKISNATSPYTHAGLTNGTTYYYVVTAVNTYGESSESAQVAATLANVITTLASGLNRPSGIAVDSTSVYWAETGAVKKVGINGGTVTTLATGLSSPLLGFPLISIAVDSTSVYWAETGAVKKVGINGGTVMTLASAGYAHAIAVDSTSVYWTESSADGSSGTVNKVGINGGTVTTLASAGGGAYPIAVDSTSVYWDKFYLVNSVPSSGNLMKVGINGGTVTTLASANTYGIAVDSTSVYWTGGTTVNKVGINGGTVTTLASGLNGAYAIAVDSASVYWTESNYGNNDVMNVKKVGINGGTVMTLASRLSSPLMSIAVDSTSVYWTEGYSNGTVNKVPK